MNDMITTHAILALAAGLLILLMPRLLNYVVALYLIAIGVSGLTAQPDATPARYALTRLR